MSSRIASGLASRTLVIGEASVRKSDQTRLLSSTPHRGWGVTPWSQPCRPRGLTTRISGSLAPPGQPPLITTATTPGTRRMYSNENPRDNHHDAREEVSRPETGFTGTSTEEKAKMEELVRKLRYTGLGPPQSAGTASTQDSSKRQVPGPGAISENVQESGKESSSGFSNAGFSDPEARPPPPPWVKWIVLGSFIGLLGWSIGKPGDDTKDIESDIKDQWFGGRVWKRMTCRRTAFFSYFRDPLSAKLLPDPLPPQYQRPYTLVINMDDTLVRSVWNTQHGWRTVKRPGIEYFLAYLCQFYEIVVFTKTQAFTANSILDQIDPFGYIMYRLFRESTRYINGKTYKDISCLNRDLSKVVVLDVDPEVVNLQPENAIILKRWEGQANDNTLLSYIPFLETLALTKVADVRPILNSYGSNDIPSTFAANQSENYEKIRKARSSAFGGILSTASGVGQQMEPLEFFKQKHLAFIRDQMEYRKQYLEAKKKADEENEKKMQEALAKKTTVFEWLTGRGPVPPPGFPPQDFGAQQQGPGTQPGPTSSMSPTT